MVTVALIGADGAGKTTLARALEQSAELPVKYLYMGVNTLASNHMLPTTRLICSLRRSLGGAAPQGGPPGSRPSRARRRGGVAGLAAGVRASLAVANRVCEEWYRVAVARRFERRGFIVLFDRHFYADYWAHDVAAAGRSIGRRLHGAFLKRLPRPDCTILLDAPADVLFARKPEGTLELLESRRREYLALKSQDPSLVVVDASRPRSAVQREVLDILLRMQSSRGGTR